MKLLRAFDANRISEDANVAKDVIKAIRSIYFDENIAF